ncbi:MAG: catalytic domain of component of various dehydrogenase complexe [Deltaproteobacteria bacterium]|nr:catalytic domain of component of various dehydrogenase complexe [Deltaproteobacteria bacterium]
MASEIIMPKLSDTMSEGQLGAWRKSVGERIERGDIIAEVETDKATMDLEAFTSGILLEQRVKAGEMVPVGTVIGLIGAAGEAAAGQLPLAAESQPQTAPLPTAESPAAAPAEPPDAAPVPSAAPLESSATHGVQAAPIVRR